MRWNRFGKIMFMLSGWENHPEHDEMLQLHFQNFRTEIRVNWVGLALFCTQPLFCDALKLAFSSFPFVKNCYPHPVMISCWTLRKQPMSACLDWHFENSKPGKGSTAQSDPMVIKDRSRECSLMLFCASSGSIPFYLKTPSGPNPVQPQICKTDRSEMCMNSPAEEQSKSEFWRSKCISLIKRILFFLSCPSACSVS